MRVEKAPGAGQGQDQGQERIKVIYIAGAGRSGSTLIDRILGSSQGATSFGELRPLWQYGLEENRRCACGDLFNDCTYWRAVMEDCDLQGSDAKDLMRLHRSVDHSVHFLKLYTGLYSSTFGKNLEDYKAILSRLYRSMAKQAGGTVIIDSSKVPSRALILNSIPGIDVYVLHMVRDVRALVSSWQKHVQNPGNQKNVKQRSAGRVIFFWMMRNLMAAQLINRMPYARVRYEDFMDDPKAALKLIGERLEPLRSLEPSFTDDKTALLPRLHMISGSRSRFSYGATPLHLDDEWHKNLGQSKRQWVSCVASPLLYHYDYFKKTIAPQNPKDMLSTESKER